MRISAVIITKNEERNIERCLVSLQDIVDEIVVVDSFSTDNTKSICEKYSVRFFQQEWKGYAKQKNDANSLAQYDYILSIDADENLSDTLINSILSIKRHPVADAYCMNRCTCYCGKWIYHCGWYPDTKIRLWKKDKATWSSDVVHEKLLLSSDAVVRHIKGDILHNTYSSIAEHIDTANKYTALVAESYYAKRKKCSVVKIIFAPLWGFFRDYFIRRGFLDGYYGFVICTIAAFSIFLKYIKLRQLYRDEK
jgi:glycosyltransferase involved in cell wall biosynthesis